MRYIIYGAGGIGGGIGGGLYQHGHDVVLICRGAHLDAIQGRGLTLRTPEQTVTLDVPAVGHPSEIAFSDDDVVILAMKSQDTEAALRDLQASVRDVPIICAQNGVANERMALRRFSRVYAMLVVMPGTHLEPGVVLVHSAPVLGLLDAGRYPRGVDPLIERVTADLRASGFSSNADPAVMRLKYGKLLTNLANAVEALCGPGGRVPELMRGLQAEAIACYRAAGIDFATREEGAERRAAALTPGEIEGGPRRGSSSWQSLARGTGAIESDFLNGEIALLGALHAVPTPLNRLVQRLANEAARDGRPPGSLSADELTAMLRAVRSDSSSSDPPA